MVIQEFFEFEWGEVTERGVEALGIVEGIDVVEEHGVSLVHFPRKNGHGKMVS